MPEIAAAAAMAATRVSAGMNASMPSGSTQYGQPKHPTSVAPRSTAGPPTAGGRSQTTSSTTHSPNQNQSPTQQQQQQQPQIPGQIPTLSPSQSQTAAGFGSGEEGLPNPNLQGWHPGAPMSFQAMAGFASLAPAMPMPMPMPGSQAPKPLPDSGSGLGGVGGVSGGVGGVGGVGADVWSQLQLAQATMQQQMHQHMVATVEKAAAEENLRIESEYKKKVTELEHRLQLATSQFQNIQNVLLGEMNKAKDARQQQLEQVQKKLSAFIQTSPPGHPHSTPPQVRTPPVVGGSGAGPLVGEKASTGSLPWQAPSGMTGWASIASAAAAVEKPQAVTPASVAGPGNSTAGGGAGAVVTGELRRKVPKYRRSVVFESWCQQALRMDPETVVRHNIDELCRKLAEQGKPLPPHLAQALEDDFVFNYQEPIQWLQSQFDTGGSDDDDDTEGGDETAGSDDDTAGDEGEDAAEPPHPGGHSSAHHGGQVGYGRDGPVYHAPRDRDHHHSSSSSHRDRDRDSHARHPNRASAPLPPGTAAVMHGALPQGVPPPQGVVRNHQARLYMSTSEYTPSWPAGQAPAPMAPPLAGPEEPTATAGGWPGQQQQPPAPTAEPQQPKPTPATEPAQPSQQPHSVAQPVPQSTATSAGHAGHVGQAGDAFNQPAQPQPQAAVGNEAAKLDHSSFYHPSQIPARHSTMPARTHHHSSRHSRHSSRSHPY